MGKNGKRKRDQSTDEPAQAGPGPNSKKRKANAPAGMQWLRMGERGPAAIGGKKDADIDALAPAARLSSTMDPYTRAVLARVQMSRENGAVFAVDFEGLKYATQGPKLVAETGVAVTTWHQRKEDSFLQHFISKDFKKATHVPFKHGCSETVGTTAQVIHRVRELLDQVAKPLTLVVHGGKQDLQLLERIFDVPPAHLRCPAPGSAEVDDLLLAEPISIDTQHLFGMYTRATRAVSLKKCCDVMRVTFSQASWHNAANDAFATRQLFFALVKAFEKRERSTAARKVIVIEEDDVEAGAPPKRVVIEIDDDDDYEHVAVKALPGEIITIDDSDDEGPASLPRGLREVINLVSDSEGSDDDIQIVPRPHEVIDLDD